MPRRRKRSRKSSLFVLASLRLALRGGGGYRGPVSGALVMRALSARILLILPLISAPAHASEAWTFCVAESSAGKDVWITGVFPASRDRERLEADLRAYLKGRGVTGADAQCPAPQGRQDRDGQRAIHRRRVPSQARRHAARSRRAGVRPHGANAIKTSGSARKSRAAPSGLRDRARSDRRSPRPARRRDRARSRRRACRNRASACRADPRVCGKSPR